MTDRSIKRARLAEDLFMVATSAVRLGERNAARFIVNYACNTLADVLLFSGEFS